MTTQHKPLDTKTQLKNLMSQHTATTYARPAAPGTPSNPSPNLKATVPSVARSSPKSLASGERLTVRLLPSEIQKIDALTLEAHQRLGERVTISDVLRIGLARVAPTAPITADELSGLRASDRRRSRSPG